MHVASVSCKRRHSKGKTTTIAIIGVAIIIHLLLLDRSFLLLLVRVVDQSMSFRFLQLGTVHFFMGEAGRGLVGFDG